MADYVYFSHRGLEAVALLPRDWGRVPREGFWVDENMDKASVSGLGMRYWIPPSQILYIERREVNVNDRR